VNTVDEVDEYDAAVERVRGYAEKIREGERIADAESLQRAADLALIYNDKRWVKELEAEGKAPKNKVFRGRPVDPESRNRFSSWVLTHEGLAPRTTRELLQVHDWKSNYGHDVPTIPPTKNAVRPLYALERRGHQSYMAEVLARAVEIADGAPVTQAHTRQAVSEHWAKYTRGEVRQLDKDAQAKRHAARIRAEAQWLVDNGYVATLAEIIQEVDRIGEAAVGSAK
jgi:hypothetical protein